MNTHTHTNTSVLKSDIRDWRDPRPPAGVERDRIVASYDVTDIVVAAVARVVLRMLLTTATVDPLERICPISSYADSYLDRC